jgi:6-phosphofructokinase 2
MARVNCDWLVLSGSLPRGVTAWFFARIVEAQKDRNCRILLDTSGPSLRTTLEGGGIFLVKPSRGELEQYAGRLLADDSALLDAARGIACAGQASYVGVTLGHLGAMLVSAEGVLRLPAPEVRVLSAVDAGDSFLGALAHALADGQSVEQAFRLGLAAGTAAVMSPGTGLCEPADIAALLAQIRP